MVESVIINGKVNQQLMNNNDYIIDKNEWFLKIINLQIKESIKMQPQQQQHPFEEDYQVGVIIPTIIQPRLASTRVRA